MLFVAQDCHKVTYSFDFVPYRNPDALSGHTISQQKNEGIHTERPRFLSDTTYKIFKTHSSSSESSGDVVLGPFVIGM